MTPPRDSATRDVHQEATFSKTTPDASARRPCPPVRAKALRIVLLLLAVMPLAGCDDWLKSHAGRSAQQAEKQAAAGDYQAALSSYEAALGDAPKAAEIHFRLAHLCDEKLKDSVGAIYHYQRYLELASDGTHAREAKAFIKETQAKLLASFAEGTLTQKDAARLKNENFELRKQAAELHAQVKDLREAGRFSLSPTDSRPPPAGSRTYVIQPGDTLASISRRFYKTSTRWKDIEDANFNRLGHKAKLKPGTTLVIP